MKNLNLKGISSLMVAYYWNVRPAPEISIGICDKTTTNSIFEEKKLVSSQGSQKVFPEGEIEGSLHIEY